MGLYPKLAATALNLLSKFGQVVILRRYPVGGGTYDPVTGVTTANTIDESRKAIVTDPPGSRLGPTYGRQLQNGTLVQDADRWMYMDANGMEPRPQDHMVVQGFEYTIIDVQMIGPGGVPVVYLVAIRT